MTRESIFHELKEELEAIRVRQLDQLLIHRHIFQQFAHATSPYAGSHHGGALSKWMAGNYVTFAATSVRKMTDNDRRTHSLLNFLKKVKRHASEITRERLRVSFVRSAPSWASAEREQEADKLFDFGVGQEGLDQLTEEVVEGDITSVKASAQEVIEIVNNWIAHDNKNPRVSTLRLGKLDAAIDTLNSVYVRYHRLVTGNVPPRPLLDIHNCEEDFHKIWPPK